jgi:PilZ domain
MAGLHSTERARRPARKPDDPRPESRGRRARAIETPPAGSVAEVVIADGVVLPATVSRVQDDLIWVRMPPVVPCGHSFRFAWAGRDGARESVAAAVMHSGDGGLMARMEQTQRADRRVYERIQPTRRVLVRAMLFDVAGDDSVGTIFGQLADASFGSACFRTAGAPSIGQAMMLWFRDDGHEQVGHPVPAKVVSVTPETRNSRLVCVSFGRVGLAAQTIRDVLMGVAEPAAAP